MTASGPRLSVTRRAQFCAARAVASPALDPAAAERLFGRDQLLHGHDYTLYVTLAGEAPAAVGMVMDLKELARVLRQQVVAALDRTRLDGHPFLAGLPATTENLAAAIWRRLLPLLPGLSEVELVEGPYTRVRYRGE